MNKPFESGKNAKELGIDTSRKFVVVRGGSLFNVGEIVELSGDEDSVVPKFSNGRKARFCCWGRLAYADERPRTLRDMKVGDIIVKEKVVYPYSGEIINNARRKVLAVLGEVCLVSTINYFNSTEGRWDTIDELINGMWKLEQPHVCTFKCEKCGKTETKL